MNGLNVITDHQLCMPRQYLRSERPIPVVKIQHVFECDIYRMDISSDIELLFYFKEFRGVGNNSEYIYIYIYIYIKRYRINLYVL